MKKPKITPEEKQAIIEAFKALPKDTHSPYALIGSRFRRSTSAVFTLMKKNKAGIEKVKLFNHRVFPF